MHVPRTCCTTTVAVKTPIKLGTPLVAVDWLWTDSIDAAVKKVIRSEIAAGLKKRLGIQKLDESVIGAIQTVATKKEQSGLVAVMQGIVVDGLSQCFKDW